VSSRILLFERWDLYGLDRGVGRRKTVLYTREMRSWRLDCRYDQRIPRQKIDREQVKSLKEIFNPDDKESGT
jgi:hypothetical protein